MIITRDMVIRTAWVIHAVHCTPRRIQLKRTYCNLAILSLPRMIWACNPSQACPEFECRLPTVQNSSSDILDNLKGGGEGEGQKKRKFYDDDNMARSYLIQHKYIQVLLLTFIEIGNSMYPIFFIILGEEEDTST